MTVRVVNRLRPTLFALALISQACESEPRWESTGETTTSLRYEYNLPYVQLRTDDTHVAWVVLDTGAPYHALDPRVFGASATGFNTWNRVELLGGSLGPFASVPIQPCGASVCGFEQMNGIVGGPLARAVHLRVDPCAKTAIAGRPSQSSGNEVTWELRGGGRYQFDAGIMSIPPTRIIFDIVIEGRLQTALLDTGASSVILRPELFDALIADGRNVRTLQTQTITGNAQARVTRLRSLSVQHEVEVPNVLASSGVLFDFDALSREVGRPVQVLLGGTFLREFVMDIDVARHRLTFERCIEHSLILDEFTRIGIVLAPSGTGGWTASILPGSLVDPSLQGSARECFVRSAWTRVRGQSLAGMRPYEVDMLLRGRRGESISTERVDGCSGLQVTENWIVEGLLN